MKKKLLVLSILSFLVGGPSSFGQGKKQWRSYGDLSFSEKDYIGASVYYQRAIEYGGEDLELLWKHSHALMLSRNYKEAENQFKSLIQRDTSGVYLDSKLWLGILLKNNGKYSEAKEVLNDYLSIVNIDRINRQRALNELAGCELAMKSEDSRNSKDLRGLEINSSSAEFAAFFAKKDLMIYSAQRPDELQEEGFEGMEHFPVKLYSATKTDNNWKPNGTMSEVINNAGYHVCNGTLSADGRFMYFSACDKGFTCQIMASKYSNGVWSKPIVLNDNINKPGFNTTQPSICKIGSQEVLLFVSDRPGGAGKLDIWYSIKKGDTDFLEPINLGSKINSVEDDVCPWYNAQDSTLYFSSNWLPGYGGYDIFRSKGDLKRMAAPENLGPYYNSSANDLYFLISQENEIASFSSNRLGSIKDTLGNFNDIWHMTWQSGKKEQVAIVESENIPTPVSKAKELLPLQLYFHNDQPVAGANDTISKYDYKQVNAQYLNLKNQYIVNNQNDSLKVDVFFNDQITGGFEKLNQFLDLLELSLRNGEDIVLGIKGFTSNVGSFEYNSLLAKRRLSSLEQYIATYRNGIFKPYLKNMIGGSLKILRLPFERNLQEKEISRSGVYDLDSAIDRKIEIYNLTLLGDK